MRSHAVHFRPNIRVRIRIKSGGALRLNLSRRRFQRGMAKLPISGATWKKEKTSGKEKKKADFSPKRRATNPIFRATRVKRNRAPNYVRLKRTNFHDFYSPSGKQASRTSASAPLKTTFPSDAGKMTESPKRNGSSSPSTSSVPPTTVRTWHDRETSRLRL